MTTPMIQNNDNDNEIIYNGATPGQAKRKRVNDPYAFGKQLALQKQQQEQQTAALLKQQQLLLPHQDDHNCMMFPHSEELSDVKSQLDGSDEERSQSASSTGPAGAGDEHDHSYYQQFYSTPSFNSSSNVNTNANSFSPSNYDLSRSGSMRPPFALCAFPMPVPVPMPPPPAHVLLGGIAPSLPSSCGGCGVLKRNKGVACRRHLQHQQDPRMPACALQGLCPYRHFPQGAATVESVPRTVCKFHKEGGCMRDVCPFFHGTEQQLRELTARGVTVYRPVDYCEIRDAEEDMEREAEAAPAAFMGPVQQRHHGLFR